MELRLTRRQWFWLAYSLMLIAATVLATEIAASFIVPSWPARDIRPVSVETTRAGSAEPLADQPELIRVYNDWALLDRPRTFAKPAGVQFRSVLVGDSFLEGMFVREPVSAHIEKLWAAEGRSGMEAINFGVAATGPSQYYYRIRNVALRLKPDVIVLMIYAGNDFVNERLAPWAVPPVLAELPLPSLIGAVAPRTAWLAVNRLRLSEVGRGNAAIPGEFELLNRWVHLPPADRLDKIVHHIRTYYYPEMPEKTVREILSRGNDRFWSIFEPKPMDRDYLMGWLLNGMIEWETASWTMARDEADADRLVDGGTISATLSWILGAQRLALEHGSQFVVAMAPVGIVDPVYVSFWKPWPKYFSHNLSANARHRRLVAALREQQVPTVDLRTVLEGIPATYRLTDGHWTERGTELVAERLSKEILRARSPKTH